MVTASGSRRGLELYGGSVKSHAASNNESMITAGQQSNSDPKSSNRVWLPRLDLRRFKRRIAQKVAQIRGHRLRNDGICERVFQPALFQQGRLQMRHPKPFFRKFTQSWYVTINGRQHPLGKDKAAAWQKYHELMASREKLRGPDLTVSSLCDAYLEWLKAHRSSGTYDKAVHYLSLFVKQVGAGCRVSTLDGAKVSEWIDQFPHWSPSAGHDAVSIVQRACNWAVRKGNLDQSRLLRKLV